MRLALLLVPMLAGSALGGCAAVHRPPATVASIAESAAPARVESRATVDTIVARLARRATARGDRTLDLLLLSGGGQHGAYGAGFLRGWRSRTDAPMPAFDLVTGVSTGSLQAPFALIGTPAALDTLRALYLSAAERIAPSIDWWFLFRRTGGVVNTSKLRATLERVVDPALSTSLRREFAADRQLDIATTDMDLGIGRVWDMARELDTSAAGLARARSLFLATAAIPGIFPPVVLDGHVHADGGIVANVLSPLELRDYEALAARLRAAGVTEPVTVRVWVVMNLFTHAPPAVIDPASRRKVNGRSNGLLFYAQQPQLLERLDATARAVNLGVPGLRMELHHTAVPAELSTAPGANKLFDAAWMRRLEQLAYDRARGPAPWDSLPSEYERPAGP